MDDSLCRFLGEKLVYSTKVPELEIGDFIYGSCLVNKSLNVSWPFKLATCIGPFNFFSLALKVTNVSFPNTLLT